MSDEATGRRLTPLRAAGWSALYLGMGFALWLVLAAGGLAVTGGFRQLQTGTRPLIVQSVSGLIGFGLATWVIGLRVLKLSPRELGWVPRAGASRSFAWGLVLGTAPAAVAIGLSLVVGHAAFTPDDGGPSDYARRVALTTLLLAPAALAEEIMFRGVSQVTLAKGIGRLPALLLLSLLFALAHVLNPNHTTLGLVNIALAGLFLGVVFYTPGGLWAAWGAHLGWNATLAALDTPVSGWPFNAPWIDYQPGGPPWLTGGAFGPEGGVLASLAVVLAMGAAWRWGKKENR